MQRRTAIFLALATANGPENADGGVAYKGRGNDVSDGRVEKE